MSNIIQIDSFSNQVNNIIIISDSLSSDKLIPIIEKINHDKKLWNLITYDTVFAMIVSLIVFVLGIFLDRLNKYCERKKKEKELRIYFKKFVDRIADRISPKLAKMYKNQYQEMNIDDGVTVTPPEILTDDFQRIRNIQDKDLFNAFNDNSKEFLPLVFNQVDFIEILIKRVDYFHKYARKENQDLRERLKIDLNNYFEALSNYVEHVRINKPNYEGCLGFSNMVTNLVISYHSNENSAKTLTEVYESVVRRIQLEIVRTNIFRVDPFAFPIAKLGKEISINYQYLRENTIRFRLEYRKFSKMLKKSCKKLIKIKDRMDWSTNKNK